MLAVVERQAVAHDRACAPAECDAGFVKLHRAPGARELDGGRTARPAAADDDHAAALCTGLRWCRAPCCRDAIHAFTRFHADSAHCKALRARRWRVDPRLRRRSALMPAMRHASRSTACAAV